ncbi:MAG: hypothetical protein LBC89_06260 [Bacteroidales bacterium]|nr:hypothetical protein [Bacteroidales bacterium]
MKQITGIKITKDSKGIPTSITFNYRKYGRFLRMMFNEHSINFPVVEKSTYNDKKEVKELLSIKSDMESGIRNKVDMNNFWGE